MLTAQSNRPFHASMSVQIAGASASIPTLQRAKAGYQPRLRIHIDVPIANHRNESRKAIDTVRVHAVAGCLGKETRTALRTAGRKAQLAQHAFQGRLHFVKGNSIHRFLNEWENQWLHEQMLLLRTARMFHRRWRASAVRLDG
jgi:hypothetical protein